jgi:hypothetical protein
MHGGQTREIIVEKMTLICIVVYEKNYNSESYLRHVGISREIILADNTASYNKRVNKPKRRGK